MRPEYEAIAAAGVTVQLDCPDLAMGRHSAYADMDQAAFRARVALNIEALNHAVRNIPADRLRMHLCWGNYPGPHHHDVDLAEIIDLVWRAKPQTVLFEAANPRHAHEWKLFETIEVPDGKILCPGRHRAPVELHRASRAGRPADRTLRPHRRSRTGHGRRGLRLQRPRRDPGRRSRCRLGEAALARSGRRDRDGATLAVMVRSAVESQTTSRSLPVATS